MKENKAKAGRRLFSTLFCAVFGGLFLLIGAFAYFSAQWYITVFGDTGFDSILSTLTAGVGGTSGDLVVKFLLCALLPALIFSGLITVILFALPKRNLVAKIGTKLKLILYPFPRILSFLLALLFSASLFYSGALRAGAVEYLKAVRQRSSIFEEYYVDPATVEITFPEQKRNLIYIFLESMETSFLSQELGGGNDVNSIPELYELARNNVNFSHNDSVGGLFTLSGGTWTIGAMVSQTVGVPLKVPLNTDGNDYGQDEFLPGITTLSDVLHQAGYSQALMVGSDATFGGRKQYYEQHGTDQIYDLFTARQEGVIPEDYHVWWGMEDAKLFSYAKQELTKIAASDQPFA
ncbi:MAG: sulfatase-like hydrolase/transferase, partial [Clostridia bacterium]|nr:sulfatase-like hydrolase/transferase [Clostridia bacterium]